MPFSEAEQTKTGNDTWLKFRLGERNVPESVCKCEDSPGWVGKNLSYYLWTLSTSATSAARNLPPNNTRITSALVSCSGRVFQDTISVYCHPSIYHHLTRICQFDLSWITYNERPVVLAVGIAHTYALNPADTSNLSLLKRGVLILLKAIAGKW